MILSRNPFERVFAPFNTRTTSAAGVALVTSSVVALVRNFTNPTWLISLYVALLHQDPARDVTPIFQLAAIGFGVLLGCIGLYIGAPWFVRPDQTVSGAAGNDPASGAAAPRSPAE